MYLSLYRKWRPRIFDEISGQEHITSILKKQSAANRVSHAYLFCGTRGTGKTSSAKILAKAVNCENPVDGNPCNCCTACISIDAGSATDVLEIDAASNNKVDNIRDLRDEVVYPPSVLKKRVYIIDEVHMLTDSAFNALLKTLEEPPEYVVFILATTEINELPPTIISRCIRFDFSRIDEEAVIKRLEYVAEQEGIQISHDAAKLIANLADGSMRDALSLLEACSNGHTGEISKDIVRNVLGLASDEVIYSLLHAIANKNVADAIDIIDEIHRSSKDISVFIDDLSVAVRDIIIDKQITKFGKSARMHSINPDVFNELTVELLFYISSVLEDTQNRISKYATNKRVVLEMAVIRMCDRSISDSPKALAARISDLEKRISLMEARGIVINDSPVNITEPVIEQKQKSAENETEINGIAFDGMSDVYEFLSDDNCLSSFLQQTEVLINDNHITILGDNITLSMLTPEVSKLTDAFTAASHRCVDVNFIEKNDKKQTDGQISLIDEL